MVPVQVGALEHDVGNDTELERSAILDKAQAVGWYLTTVFEEGNHPRKGDDAYEWPVVADTVLLEFQMPIPSERHEDVA